MPPRKPPSADLLDLLISKASALHAAGITSISIDGMSATLVPPPPTAAAQEKPTPPPASHIDPLQDPSTFPGGAIPGFARPKPKE